MVFSYVIHLYRQLYDERRPLADCAFRAYLAAVVHYAVLDDRKSETGSLDLPRAAFVNTVEALENAAHILFGNAHARISDRYHRKLRDM